MIACASASSITPARFAFTRSGGTMTSRLATLSRLQSATAALRGRRVISRRLRPRTASCGASTHACSTSAGNARASTPSSSTGAAPALAASAACISSRRRDVPLSGSGERMVVEVNELPERLGHVFRLDIAQGIHAEAVFKSHNEDREAERIKPAVQQREVIVQQSKMTPLLFGDRSHLGNNL